MPQNQSHPGPPCTVQASLRIVVFSPLMLDLHLTTLQAAFPATSTTTKIFNIQPKQHEKIYTAQLMIVQFMTRWVAKILNSLTDILQWFFIMYTKTAVIRY